MRCALILGLGTCQFKLLCQKRKRETRSREKKVGANKLARLVAENLHKGNKGRRRERKEDDDGEVARTGGDDNDNLDSKCEHGVNDENDDDNNRDDENKHQMLVRQTNK